MNNKEALEKLKAYLKCQKRQVKGIHEDCNNKKCDNCDLCYIQGTTGEHIEAIESAIQSLESHKRIIKRLKKELKLAEDVEERAVKEVLQDCRKWKVRKNNEQNRYSKR